MNLYAHPCSKTRKQTMETVLDELSSLPSSLVGEVLSSLGPLDLLAVARTSKVLRMTAMDASHLNLSYYGNSNEGDQLCLRAGTTELPKPLAADIDDITLGYVVALFGNIKVLVLHGLPSVSLETPCLPPLAKLYVCDCPQLCLSPGTICLLKYIVGIGDIVFSGAGMCSWCPCQAVGGCVECGAPACIADGQAFGCADTVFCEDCGAHTCAMCSVWLPGFGAELVYKCYACRPSEWCLASSLPHAVPPLA